jgi:hypothetical protein
MGTLTQTKDLIKISAALILSISIVAGLSTSLESVFAIYDHKGQVIRVSDALMQNCLNTGYSYNSCENMLYSTNPGGYCDYLSSANVGCPQIQDPAFTYSNPGLAQQESQNKINQLDNLIQQWDNLYPPGWSK